MPLVSYIRNSLRFWYYASLGTFCQNLEKRIGENLGESAGVNFSTLATSDIKILLFFGAEDQ